MQAAYPLPEYSCLGLLYRTVAYSSQNCQNFFENAIDKRDREYYINCIRC